MNKEALRTIRKNRKLLEKYKTSKENKDLQIYKEAANEVVRVVKEAQGNFEIKHAVVRKIKRNNKRLGWPIM